MRFFFYQCHEVGLEVLLPYGTRMAMPWDSWMRRGGLGLDILKIAASQKIVEDALEIKLAGHGFSGLVEKGRYLHAYPHIHADECEENTSNTCVHTNIYLWKQIMEFSNDFPVLVFTFSNS